MVTWQWHGTDVALMWCCTFPRPYRKVDHSERERHEIYQLETVQLLLVLGVEILLVGAYTRSR